MCEHLYYVSVYDTEFNLVRVTEPSTLDIARTQSEKFKSQGFLTTITEEGEDT